MASDTRRLVTARVIPKHTTNLRQNARKTTNIRKKACEISRPIFKIQKTFHLFVYMQNKTRIITKREEC